MSSNKEIECTYSNIGSGVVEVTAWNVAYNLPVGFAWLRPIRSTEKVVCDLLYIFVREDYRGRKVATSLMEGIFSMCDVLVTATISDVAMHVAKYGGWRYNEDVGLHYCTKDSFQKRVKESVE